MDLDAIQQMFSRRLKAASRRVARAATTPKRSTRSFVRFTQSRAVPVLSGMSISRRSRTIMKACSISCAAAG
jgi:phage-related minor tail protein